LIDRLEMFIALANERHFGRAAESIGVTQPSLSSAIKHLEEQFGVKLVNRGSRFQGLTPEGKHVLEQAREIVAATRALRDEMRSIRSGLSGELRLGVIPTALPMVVNLVEPYAKRYPLVRIQILSRASSEIIDQIERLELDAGMTYLEPAPPKRLTQLPLYLETYCLLLSTENSLSRRRVVSWQEVGELPLCLLTRDMQNRRIIDRHLRDAGVTAAPRVESNSVIVLASHVATGRWASVVPFKLAEIFMPSGRVAAVPIEGSGTAADPAQPVGLIVSPREPRTPQLAALLDEARRLTMPEAPRR
jgi:DNA-binding transcriptional LysR family regulator